MGHKVNPIGFRLGINKDWQSKWYASKKNYAAYSKEDHKIRTFLLTKLPAFDIESISIERTGDSIKVLLNANNVGAIIGKKGAGVDSIRDRLGKALDRKVDFIVKEVRAVNTSAQLIANSIAEQIEKRVSFKKAMKSAGFNAIRGGALGIRICCSGKLGGTDIARNEWFRSGRVPLHTIRADIDYATATAKTTHGTIGVKSWVCKGEV